MTDPGIASFGIGKTTEWPAGEITWTCDPGATSGVKTYY